MVRFDQPCHSVDGALNYFAEHMGKGDYLTQGGRLQMLWYGKGADRLGLHGAVQIEQFNRLCDGKYPDTGEKLTVRDKAYRRVCYFAQISVPKDVSIALLVGGDRRIKKWWEESVQETLQEIESVVETRVRGGGRKDENRLTGNMVTAVVTHDASRSLDPQLHTHLCIMNVTYDQVEKRWKGIQPTNFYRHQGFFREVSYNKLAQRMREGGYDLERSSTMGFEIKGFPAPVRDQFSKRRNDILKRAAELGVSSQDGLQAVTSKTRANKQNVASSELKQAWIKECGDDIAAIERVIEEAQLRAPTPILSKEREAIGYAVEHLFERQSVVNERILLREALSMGRGSVELSQLRRELNRQIAQGDLIRRGEEITSRETLAMESEFIHWARSSWDKYARMGDDRAINPTLKAEHQEAVSKILRCRNRIVVLQGDAGTGKTTSLKEVVRGIEAAAGAVFACAPSSGAADGLRKEVTPESDTIQQLLVNVRLQQKIANRIIIVDEAGLLSVRQMRDLCRLAKCNNNRLILAGDTKQHTSVEAGDALRALQKYCEIETVPLTKIIRQRQPAYRKVVELLAAKQPFQAFKQMEKLGEVHEVISAPHLFDRAARDYLETISKGKSCLAIAPVWSEIETFTDVVRAKLKKTGRLKTDERQVTVTSPFGWTQAQRKQTQNYKPGQVLQFHRETVIFAKDEVVKLVEVKGQRLVVERTNGEQHAFDPKRVHSFDVGESRAISVATGDRLLIRANLKAAAIQNGDIVEVTGFNPDGAIRLQDGRILPCGFRRFTHGYATTSHAAQGKTVDRGILILGEDGIRAANLQQAYVSNSRFRDTQAIYTTNRKAAKSAMANDLDRKLAHELRERQVRQWRAIETLVAAADAWRAIRQRVVAAFRHQQPNLEPGVIRHAA